MGKEDRDVLVSEHTRLVADEQRMSGKYEEVKELFKKLEDAYAESKGTFSVGRYGQLKDMIKNTANDQVIQSIRNTLPQAQGAGSKGKGGLVGLLRNAHEFSAGSQQQQEASAQPPEKKGKMFGFVKKLKNITGFSNDPVTDEDVMSNTDLERDNGRKQRAIARYQSQLGKAVTKLEKLQHTYQASKAHAPPKRYQELKDMIKECVAEKLV